MGPLRDLIDKLFNWSGGAYVGLSTLTVLGLAVAQYIAGEPKVLLLPGGGFQIYIIHTAPEWFVGPIGVFTIILGLFVAGKPINTYVNSKAGAVPTEPAPPPAEIPLQK